jgi:hypothetical protein
MANVLINNVLDGRRACFVGVVPSGPNSGSVFLVSDAGVTGSPDSALSIRGSGIASNSQCSINAAGSSASWTGGSLILTFAITFSEAFGGNKVVFLASQDKSPPAPAGRLWERGEYRDRQL